MRNVEILNYEIILVEKFVISILLVCLGPTRLERLKMRT